MGFELVEFAAVMFSCYGSVARSARMRAHVAEVMGKAAAMGRRGRLDRALSKGTMSVLDHRSQVAGSMVVADKGVDLVAGDPCRSSIGMRAGDAENTAIPRREGPSDPVSVVYQERISITISSHVESRDFTEMVFAFGDTIEVIDLEVPMSYRSLRWRLFNLVENKMTLVGGGTPSKGKRSGWLSGNPIGDWVESGPSDVMVLEDWVMALRWLLQRIPWALQWCNNGWVSITICAEQGRKSDLKPGSKLSMKVAGGLVDPPAKFQKTEQEPARDAREFAGKGLRESSMTAVPTNDCAVQVCVGRIVSADSFKSFCMLHCSLV
ncbi:hypothetical protein NE237_015884 [Protea cynaroides]|uniref:Uncharacterized protein n=1 Tax=Protea cynaroides TaxID=273540 RepID=A0A9Q0KEL0_9MAGN|nr:hypothetical protein NE237_015884 [Protea cynaroides]